MQGERVHERQTLKGPGGLGFRARDVQQALTLLAAVGAIIYAFGYVIVTGKLVQYGISEVNLVRARYISVGILFFVNALLVLAIPYFVMTWFLERKKKDVKDGVVGKERVPRAASIGAREPADSSHQEAPVVDAETKLQARARFKASVVYGLAAMAAFALAIGLSILFIYYTSTPNWARQAVNTVPRQMLRDRWSLLLNWYAPLFGAGLMLPLLRPLRARRTVNLIWTTLGMTIVFILIATRGYTLYIYYHLTPALGGGDYYVVRVVGQPAAKDSPDVFAQLLNVQPGRPSSPVWLYDESDEYYFFVVPNDPSCEDIYNCQGGFHGVKIEKKSIKGLIY